MKIPTIKRCALKVAHAGQHVWVTTAQRDPMLGECQAHPNQNQQYGARTGQHEQVPQQAMLCGDAALDLILRYQPAPTRVEAAWPSTPADVQGACTMFAFADRIEIDLPKRCAECGTVYTTDECPDCATVPDVIRDTLQDLAGDDAYETWRDRQ